MCIRDSSSVRDHAHDPEEQHEQEDHDAADAEANPHIAVGLGGEDALPRALIKQLGADDRDPERHQGLEALREPARRVVELFLGDLCVHGRGL